MENERPLKQRPNGVGTLQNACNSWRNRGHVTQRSIAKKIGRRARSFRGDCFSAWGEGVGVVVGEKGSGARGMMGRVEGRKLVAT